MSLAKTYIIDGPAQVVVPTITCQARALVNINGRTVDLQPGVWINRDLELLLNGKNRVTVNTTRTTEQQSGTITRGLHGSSLTTSPATLAALEEQARRVRSGPV